jgi:hypothetical protein
MDSIEKIFLRLKYAIGESVTEGGITIVLGAGCSLASLKEPLSTHDIIKKCLESHDIVPHENWHEMYESFVNVVWSGKGEQERVRLLAKYLDNALPSAGYKNLKALVEHGYIKNIITTNFDLLLDKTMEGLSYRLMVGEKSSKIIGKEAEAKLSILKVHGDLNHKNIKFAPSELNHLPKLVARKITEMMLCASLKKECQFPY